MPLPGNPKGSWYDDGGVGARGGAPPEPSTSASAAASAPSAAASTSAPTPTLPKPVPPPPKTGNPKGSWYDDGGYHHADSPVDASPLVARPRKA